MSLSITNFVNKQAGTTLVEVMLACALGVFLLSGLIQICLACKKTFSQQQAIMHLQENGRYAVHFLNQYIRMAGYSGCEATPPFVNTDSALIGYGKKLPAILQGKVTKDTDSIVISSCRLENGKQRYNQYAFFISATSRKNKSGGIITSLYEMPLDGSKRELVANVERMRINYGVTRADSPMLQYESADNIQDWHQVKAVDIALLLGSNDPILAKAQSEEFYGEPLPADRYLHRQWHTYIALREQL